MSGRRALGWMADAACTDRLDLPWITDTESVPAGAVRAMRAVCDTCPVRVACAAYVQSSLVTGGTWAGVDRDTVPTGSRRTRPVAAVVVQGELPGLHDLLVGVA